MTSEHVVAAARTVNQVADHFIRLKERANELIDAYEASNRGYFTPTEDEGTRHLFVSYWQSRNALIELVNSYRQYEKFDEVDRHGAFLAAYGGALVLVDAARFLRAYAHKRPVIRAKLNEAEPHFGIPAGTYARIQNSLTSPVRAWHIYHATRYFDNNADEWARLIETNTVLSPLIGLIRTLQSSSEISLANYTIARTRERTRSLRTRVSNYLLGRAFYGLQKSVSGLMAEKYVVPGHKPGLPPDIFDDLAERLKPGDVIVVRKLHAITNYFLPGYWPHAALYLGTVPELKQLGLPQHANVQHRWERIEQLDSKPHRALEALADGVHFRPLSRSLASDAIVVLRPKLSNGQIAEALARGIFHEGKPYDFDFDFTRSDRMVCSEVVYRAYEGIGGMTFELTKRAGRMTLAAEDILRMALVDNGFDVVAVYSPEHSTDVLTETGAIDVLAKTAGSS